jgi:hypothetical protein
MQRGYLVRPMQEVAVELWVADANVLGCYLADEYSLLHRKRDKETREELDERITTQ